MKSLFLLLLFCHVSSPVKHSLKFLFTTSSGSQNLPELMAAAMVDDVQAAFCNSNKTIEIKQDVWKKLLKDNPWLMEVFTQRCFEIQPKRFKSILNRIMQHFNQTEGIHILQLTESYESDEQTGEVVFVQGGYDGEDFMSIDLKKRMWITVKPEADAIKQEWEADKTRMDTYVNFVTQNYPKWLRMFLNYGRSFLSRTDRPSVSLLQKSPSSPVSCHATGFYPDRATMFWRKDGQELHEDVDHEEILPNHDGTFQMRVDLNISSVKPEDWKRYDCMFQLSGVEDIVTKLDKAVIRTNLGKTGVTHD
ncbi:Major histocompatibility complex class I-related gene protein [Channa argus]|uniref:Major histocompatibility complex class I-related gene protein n=1 Tax=Channa argus TaxID=215402 RepID=A0A6G1QWK5_CHAAH|nr:Major histocompatibility complex class I-related gene protein [Channa argus]